MGVYSPVLNKKKHNYVFLNPFTSGIHLVVWAEMCLSHSEKIYPLDKLPGVLFITKFHHILLVKLLSPSSISDI